MNEQNTPQAPATAPVETKTQHVLHVTEDALTHLMHAVIAGLKAGLKAHPKAVMELASMLATQKVDVKALEEIGKDVAISAAPTVVEELAK